MKRLSPILGFVLFSMWLQPSFAQTDLKAKDIAATSTPAASNAPGTPEGAAAGPTLLAMGTSVKLELDKTVKSNGSRSGDPVMFHTSEAVYSTDGSHTLFVDKGAVAMGHVIVAKRRGFIGRRGDLQFQIDYVMNVQGKRVYLSTTCQGGRALDRGAISITTDILFGPAGLLVQGGDKKYTGGTVFTVYVDQDAKMALQ